jgi:hypothetical protein
VPIDWFEITFFPGGTTDTGMPPTTPTDFYISSMMIVPEPATSALLMLGTGGALLGLARRRQEQ